MNKKFLIMAVATVAVVVLFAPMLGTAQAFKSERSKTVETFTTPYGVPPLTFSGMVESEKGSEKFLCDGTLRIASGTVRDYIYNGPLGTGTVTLETVISITQVDGYIFFAGAWRNATGHGSGIYKWTIEIVDGPYGTGSLEGIGRLTWDYDYTETPPRFEQWDTATLRPTAGDLDIIRVCAEGYLNAPNGWYWTETTVVS